MGLVYKHVTIYDPKVLCPVKLSISNNCVYAYKSRMYIKEYIYRSTYRPKHATYLVMAYSVLNECFVVLLRWTVASVHLHVERVDQ